MAYQPLSRHAVRVSDGDRAAVDVQPVVRYPELVAAVEDLDRERLVELPEIDVLDLEPRPREELWHRVNRADAHLVGLAARDREAAEHP